MNIVSDIQYFEEEEKSINCKNGRSIWGNGIDRHRRHGVCALASIYEKIFQSAAMYQESAGESISFFYSNVLYALYYSLGNIFAILATILKFALLECNNFDFFKKFNIIHSTHELY